MPNNLEAQKNGKETNNLALMFKKLGASPQNLIKGLEEVHVGSNSIPDKSIFENRMKRDRLWSDN